MPKTMVITGCSSGLGRATALHCYGWRLRGRYREGKAGNVAPLRGICGDVAESARNNLGPSRPEMFHAGSAVPTIRSDKLFSCS